MYIHIMDTSHNHENSISNSLEEVRKYVIGKKAARNYYEYSIPKHISNDELDTTYRILGYFEKCEKAENDLTS